MKNLRLRIFKLSNLGLLVIKQFGGHFFITSPDSIIIDIPGLAFIIKFLVMNDLMSIKVLEGIIEEYKSE